MSTPEVISNVEPKFQQQACELLSMEEEARRCSKRFSICTIVCAITVLMGMRHFGITGLLASALLLLPWIMAEYVTNGDRCKVLAQTFRAMRVRDQYSLVMDELRKRNPVVFCCLEAHESKLSAQWRN